MGHLKKFQTKEEYEVAKNNKELSIPNYSLIVSGKLMFYEKLINNYYSSFDLAVSDINNNLIGEHAQKELTDETVCNVYFDDGLNIFLFKDVESNNNLLPTIRLRLFLNGKVITSYCDTFINSNYDIEIKNGSIDCKPKNYDVEAYCLLLSGCNGLLKNVTIITSTSGGGEAENPTSSIRVKNNTKLNVEECNFKFIDTNSGSTSNIYIEDTCNMDGYGNQFEIISPDGMSANIFSKGDIKLKNCGIYCYSNHTANDAGTYYASCGRAIYSLNGNVKLFNCEIYGTHSGLTIRNGELYIDGGVYDGYSHGGIYLGNSNCKSYIYNASINDVAIRGEGMYDDGVAGTNNAAMYIGGANYMNVYVDNCNFYGKIQPIVIKYNASSSHDNYLYVSNSTMNLNYTRCGIRNDGANYVTFGIGNNFSFSNLANKRNYEISSDIFYKVLKL